MKKLAQMLSLFLLMAILSTCFGVIAFADVSYTASGGTENPGSQVRAVGTQGTAYDEKGLPCYGYLNAKIVSGSKNNSKKGSRFSGSTKTQVPTAYIDRSATGSTYGSFKTTGS